MTNEELYQTLSRDDFAAANTGNLFFPAYIYVYEPETEYAMRRQIEDLKGRLERPANYFDTLVLDIFGLYLQYLESKSFGKENNLLSFLLDREKSSSKAVHETLKREAQQTDFFSYVARHIETDRGETTHLAKPYVFIHGFGKIFPWLRVSRFLNNFEQYISDYKLILFYPGKYENALKLFGKLHSENPYRSIKLINV